MDAAHHLARQIVEGRDIKLEHRKRERDRIGQVTPAGRAKAFREPVLEIVEFDLDGRFRALVFVACESFPRPATVIPTGLRSGKPGQG